MNKKEIIDSLATSVLEEQENLNFSKLSLMSARESAVDAEKQSTRPSANFIDLMNWSEHVFKKYLKDTENLNKFVHNRIIVDGPFLEFCKEKSVTVDCLYKDSIISWKTENNYEKFFVQGVFLIKCNGMEFLQNTLFHKSNSFEDEVSFFIIVSNKNYEAYLKFRNEFDAWIQLRDRSNLNIRVVGDEDVPYTRDSTWEDLFLPEETKLELRNLVENFLASKDFYKQNKMPWKRGVLLYGKPGCGKSSIIRTIMSMYNFKPVTIMPGANDAAVHEAFSYAEEQSPSLLYFEDLDSILEKNDASLFLNLMDGVSAKNGLLVIATANEVKRLKSNITDRPSRFDRKFEIPLPTNEMAYIYLKKWFGNLLSVKKCREISKLSEKHEFSYAYLKDLYISSMFEALSNNRKSPTEKDISFALARLIKEKNVLNVGSVNTDKYFR